MLDLQRAKPALDVLLNAKLPPRAAFRLSLLIDEVNRPLKAYAEQQAALAKEHGTLSEDEQQYKFEGEAATKFGEGVAALNDEVVTVKVPALKVEDLGEREVLTPAEFFNLKWLFTAGESANGTG
jgi:hypothetical protein